MAKKLFPDHTFDVVIEELFQTGWISRSRRMSETCVATKPSLTWRQVCQTASSFTNGKWHPLHNGARWELGTKHFYLIHKDNTEELTRARDITRTITGAESGWSFGSCANRCIRWAVEDVKPYERDKVMLQGGYIGFHCCYPGTYDNSVMFDMKSCYYQLINRLPSLRVSVMVTGKIGFDKLIPDERVKLSEVMSLCEQEKVFRNSIWGVMLGSATSKTHYFHGQERDSGSYFGTHYTAAALVARTAWELCREGAQETSACYAQTDGIITAGDSMPDVWKRYGMEYRAQHSGEAHIVHQHNYRIANNATKFYDGRENFKVARPIQAEPETLYSRMWL